MGHVYFIRHKKFSPVKIGHTKDDDVMNRVNSFNTASETAEISISPHTRFY